MMTLKRRLLNFFSFSNAKTIRNFKAQLIVTTVNNVGGGTLKNTQDSALSELEQVD
jgi:hypothetical protein